MDRTVVCAHCGTVIALEPRADPRGAGLLGHLRVVHREVVGGDDRPRWAELFEHFFVVPQRV